MSEMKSALERALERAEQMGKLSPQEMQAQKEAEYIPIGNGLSQRYLEHGHFDVLAEGIAKYGGEEGLIVKRAALKALVQSIELENGETTQRSLHAIIRLGIHKGIKETCQKIEGVIGQYRDKKQQRYEEERVTLEKSVRQSLHRMRISGTAVGGVNVQTGEAWRRIVSEIQSEFGTRISDLKRSLSEATKVPS
jgi:hypothetical protein